MCKGGSSVNGSCQSILPIVGLFGWWPVLSPCDLSGRRLVSSLAFLLCMSGHPLFWVADATFGNSEVAVGHYFFRCGCRCYPVSDVGCVCFAGVVFVVTGSFEGGFAGPTWVRLSCLGVSERCCGYWASLPSEGAVS